MTNEQFIEQIAEFVKRYAPHYGINVISPVIAQACLESAYGTSELAVNANNFFGLKYREGRCPKCIGTYIKVGSEQNPDGSYRSSSMTWCKFASMEDGVIGYFDFINIPNYQKLKGLTDPKKYLETIKAAGYATSINYVSNVMNVIEKWDLTKYDDDTRKESPAMSNSPLSVYKQISPNRSAPRNMPIDRITPHCVVGQCTIESLGGLFAQPSRQASSNYGIDKDGRIGLFVEEKDRSWCSSSAANDNRAVTIECASDTFEPYAMKDAVYKSLVELCTDICKRNGKSKLIWFGDKDKTLAYSPKSDEMIITVHRWFANKSCPGDWLYSRLGDLASKVTTKLGSSVEPPKPVEPVKPTPTPTPIGNQLYRVRKTWTDFRTQMGAYRNLDLAKKCADEHPGYTVFDINGKAVYSPTPSIVKLPYLVRINTDVLNIRSGPGTDKKVVGTINDHGVYTIVEEGNGEGSSKWGRLKSGAGWIALDLTIPKT